MGAATNNGKGIAGVNWAAPLLSYNIGEKVTRTVKKYPNFPSVIKDFVFLDESAVGPAINNAVNAGAKTIYLPLNWVQNSHIPNITTPNLQFEPCCKATNLGVIYTDLKKIVNNVIAALKSDNNFSSAVNATKNAYKDGTVLVAKALEYDGFGIGFPANLASDHVVFTVGAANANNQPYQYSGTPEGDDISSDPKDINVIAPGEDLETTLFGNQEYGTITNTGGSAALTTGIISLLQSAESDLTPDDIRHILQKTAAPVGGGGYDSKSGYGIIDGGAAMDYVKNHDIKHGTRTASDAQIERIYSDREITLYSRSSWGAFASGIYFADIDKVTFTIPLVPSASNDLWYNVSGTPGWSAANPNDQNRYANVELFNDHATVTTYIYNLATLGGASIGWFPASPDNIQLSYSYVGEKPPPPPPPPLPLSVTLSGPTGLLGNQIGTSSVDASGGTGSYSYSWKYRERCINQPYLCTWDGWHNLSESSSDLTRSFGNAQNESREVNLWVSVSSGSQSASDDIFINVAYPSGGGGPQSLSEDSTQSSGQ